MKDTEFRRFVEVITEGLNPTDLDHFEDLAEASFTAVPTWQEVEHEFLEEDDE